MRWASRPATEKEPLGSGSVVAALAAQQVDQLGRLR